MDMNRYDYLCKMFLDDCKTLEKSKSEYTDEDFDNIIRRYPELFHNILE